MAPALRRRLLERIQRAAGNYPVVALAGARQVGKATLARTFASSEAHFFNLEKSLDAVRLSENAVGIPGSLNGFVVIDEAQQMPELLGHCVCSPTGSLHRPASFSRAASRHG